MAAIKPSEVPRYVSGAVTAASDDLGWSGVWLRGYRYSALDVFVPPVSDFTIISYCRGSTFMERRCEGAWTKTYCAPGDVSLLTRSQRSHWRWTAEIDVSHVYLSEDLLSGVCAEATGRCVADVRLRDVLKSHDPIVTAAVAAITREAQQQALGSALYVEAVATQLAVHILRNYASVTFREPSGKGRLSPAQVHRLPGYIDRMLHERLHLETLAAVAEVGCGLSHATSVNLLAEPRTLTFWSGALIGPDACWPRAVCRSRRWRWLAGLPIRPT